MLDINPLLVISFANIKGLLEDSQVVAYLK